MSRLIDADRLDKDLRMYAERKAAGGHIEIASGVLSAAERIKQYAPTIDAVEVVRCSQCTQFYDVDDNGWGRCSNTGTWVGLNDFCSYGERREND